MKYILRACICKHNFEDYLQQLIDACKYAEIDEIMMCEDNIFISAIAQPLSAHREMANLLKKAVEKCKEHGISCSFYLKSLIGHFTSKTFVLPYTKFVGINGEDSVNEPCLLDADFAQYAATLMSYYAECGFMSIMIDDDFRSVNHCNGQIGCFCDLHLQKTSKLYGEVLTRDELISAFKNFDNESLQIKECFRKINFEGQLAFAKAIEKAVHAVDEQIQIGLMVSGVENDQFQGRDIKKLLQAFAGKNHSPFVRPAGGYYFDTLGDGMFRGIASGMKYFQVLGNDVRYISEVDVYSPRNIFTKSKKMLDLQLKTHALVGFEEVSLNIIDHFGTPPMESIEYLDLLKENKEEYARLGGLVKNKTPWGIGMPIPKNYVKNLKNNRFGFMGVNEYDLLLRKLGFPICYEETEVNFITGEVLNCYSDEEFLRLLSKGVILDQEGIRIAIERGFSEYIGATYLGIVDENCFEVFTDIEENEGHVGLRFPAYTANIHADEKCYKLNACAEARVLTELRTAELKKIADSTIYYENSLGGRVLLIATPFARNYLFYKGRYAQLHKIAKRLFKGKMPFDIENSVSIAPIWYKGEGADKLLLYNFGLDEQRFDLNVNGKQIKCVMQPLTMKDMDLEN